MQSVSQENILLSVCLTACGSWFKAIFHIVNTLRLETEQGSGQMDLNTEI